jgi:D-alanyl-D-alanine carboxypeptidase/D-alanyl-D-alanine-endopeptidase (penicillin-binding protein 4)
VSRRAAALATVGLLGAVAVSVVAVNQLAPTPRPELPTLELGQPQQLAMAPAVLPAGDQSEPVADSAAVAELVADLVQATDLGGRVGVIVTELGADEPLFAHNADAGFTPASTLKIVTAAAALRVLGPDMRFATQVVAGGAPDEVTLVGGGDPALASGETPTVPGGATLADLADETATALAEQDVTSIRLTYDDSLFGGPAIDPDWEPGYVPGGIVAPVSALMVDGARLTPGLAARADDPGRHATQAFAELLEDRGIAVDGGLSRADGAAGAVIAEAVSAPLADLVEYALATSDNDAAEVLARQVAVGSGAEGAEVAVGPAIVDAVGQIGVDISGQTVLDGSGLARGGSLSPAVLAQILNAAADPDNPQLRPILTGLPVAAFNGTLADRVPDGPGVVRAKTGTLTGVTSLAGTVSGADGRTYVFVALADDVAPANTLGARNAMDAIPAAIAECGCTAR